jgi:type I restriction enzyme S subunit
MRETVKNNCQLLEEGEFSLPKGWEVKKLGEIGNIFNGNSINAKVKKDKYLNLIDGFPYIATKDVTYESTIDYNNGIKIPFKEKKFFKIAKKHTILICAEGGSAGRKICFTEQEVCFGNKLFALYPKVNIENRFIYYYYFSSTFQNDFKNHLTGIIGGVSMNKFKQLEVPMPPILEQKRIVAILEYTFKAIDQAKTNAEQNLKNAKELFESYLNRIFEEKGDDWEEKRLGEVCKYPIE